MISFSDLSIAFHKHLHENVGSTYYVRFSKLTEGETISEKLWVQPIWGEIPRYLCASIVTVVLRCHSIIAEDPLLTNLRQLADYCVNVYRRDYNDPELIQTNKIPIYQWIDGEPLPIGYEVQTFVDKLVELPVNVYDTIAVINVYVNCLVCCP